MRFSAAGLIAGTAPTIGQLKAALIAGKTIVLAVLQAITIKSICWFIAIFGKFQHIVVPAVFPVFLNKESKHYPSNKDNYNWAIMLLLHGRHLIRRHRNQKIELLDFCHNLDNFYKFVICCALINFIKITSRQMAFERKWKNYPP